MNYQTFALKPLVSQDSKNNIYLTGILNKGKTQKIKQAAGSPEMERTKGRFKKCY